MLGNVMQYVVCFKWHKYLSVHESLLIFVYFLVVCPLEFKKPSDVINACRDLASPNPSCCLTLNVYVATLQRQMLITNRQAINCATLFGSMLQKGGITTDIYELCNVDLKDFSLQGRFTILSLFQIHCTSFYLIPSSHRTSLPLVLQKG